MKLSAFYLFLFLISCGQNGRLSNTMGNTHDTEVSKTNPNSEKKLLVNPEAQDKILPAGNMHTARAAHTATLLNNGKVLICGGLAGSNYISTAELFDPVTNTFSKAGNMMYPRVSHSATLLPDGKVLIAGGYDGNYLASTEIFDPETETFTRGSNMTTPRMGHTATMLHQGKILFAGGVGTRWTFLESAEVYDIASKSFAPTGSMHAAREAHTATLLKNGTVLIAGGHKGRRSDMIIYSSAEIYDPATGLFTETNHLNNQRHKHDAVLLPSGKVLVTGGADIRDFDGKYNSSEIYDPETQTFTMAGNMNLLRFKHNGTSVLLPNGNVFVAGGNHQAEVYDSENKRFDLVAGSMQSDRFFSSATLLPNNAVLIAGGYDASIHSTDKAWVYSFDN